MFFGSILSCFNSLCPNGAGLSLKKGLEKKEIRQNLGGVLRPLFVCSSFLIPYSSFLISHSLNPFLKNKFFDKIKELILFMKLSIIVPAYNEEKRLPKTLFSIDDYLKK